MTARVCQELGKREEKGGGCFVPGMTVISFVVRHLLSLLGLYEFSVFMASSFNMMEILNIILYTFLTQPDTYGASLEILGTPIAFKTKLRGFENSLPVSMSL